MDALATRVCSVCDRPFYNCYDCATCNEAVCDDCAIKCEDGKMVCEGCEELPEPECSCIPTDVDRMDNSGCEVHGR